MKTLQRTFTIVKPDAVRENAVGDIIEQFEKNGFRILAMKMLEISKHQAEQFYAVHASRPFFNTLTDFMSSGPIVVLALEKENAIADLPPRLHGAYGDCELQRCALLPIELARLGNKYVDTNEPFKLFKQQPT